MSHVYFEYIFIWIKYNMKKTHFSTIMLYM